MSHEQKAQRNAKRRENYSRKKAGMSEQFPCALVDSKDMREQVEVEADQITSIIS